MVVIRKTLEAYIDDCAASSAPPRRSHPDHPPQTPRLSAHQRSSHTNTAEMMRCSMIYPNIIAGAPDTPAQSPERERHRPRHRRNRSEQLPDISRLSMHDSSRSRSSHAHSHSSSHHRSKSTRRGRSPLPSPSKNVRFFDESPARQRRSNVPERPKSYVRDAPPIAINESAKDTSRRLYRQAFYEGYLTPPQSPTYERSRPSFKRSSSSRDVLTTVAEMGTVVPPPAHHERPRYERTHSGRSERSSHGGHSRKHSRS